MPTSDPDLACSRFIAATRRILAGLELQRARILDGAAQAPRTFEGTSAEFADLTGVPANDLDYYVYELGRLRDCAIEVNKAFGKPPEIVAAAEEFRAAIPRMWEMRNPITHASDDDRLDRVVWFSMLVELGDDGSVEYLVDPRYQHHDAAVKLATTLLGFLRSRLRTSIATGLAPTDFAGR